ncbi:hypothetical protein GCM10009755_22560 [Brevibacterium samyangense]|uniref:Uncharacterized protein n=1 Tax=Brevibacterium samyangense TaxID=366888 RepID=A0ABP5F015_9MICO
MEMLLHRVPGLRTEGVVLSFTRRRLVPPGWTGPRGPTGGEVCLGVVLTGIDRIIDVSAALLLPHDHDLPTRANGSASGACDQPWRCLWRGFSQMTMTRL